MEPRPRQHAHAPPPYLDQVRPNVYAYLQPDGGWGLNNAGFVVGSRNVLVIDTCFTVARVRALREAIQSVTACDVRTVVNTHHHGDHTFGNFAFVPDATIVGHDLCRAEILERGLQTTRMFPNVDFSGITIEAPSLTFPDHMTLHVDDMQIELMHLGPAHTTNDVVAWFPELRLLFCGDLVFNGCTPYIAYGSLEGSLEALRRLEALEPETIVPGHGLIGGREIIDGHRSYLEFVRQHAIRGRRAGTEPLDLASQIDLGPFEGWPDRERLVANLHRAYSELAGQPLGTPLPYETILSDIVSFNGRLPECLA